MSATSTDRAETKSAGLVVRSFHDEALRDESDTRLLLRLVPLLRPERALLSLALALIPVASFASLVQPYLVKQAVDATVRGGGGAALHGIVGYFGVSIAVELIARFAQTYTMQLAGQRSMARLRSRIFEHIQGLGLRYFDRTPIGRVVTRVTNDVDSLTELFSSGAVTAVADIVTLAGIVAFMLYLDVRLSLIAFAALPPLALIVNAFRRYARAAFRDIRGRIAQLNAYLSEQVQGLAVTQAYGREDACLEEYRQINAGHRDANYRSIRYDALLYSIVESVSVACIALILYYASVRAELVDATTAAAYVGTVVAFYEYIHRFFVPIRDLATKYTIIQASLAALERIVALLEVDELDAPPRAQGDADRSRASDQDEPPSLGFDHVTFAYRRGHPVLHDVSFAIAPGERVALVGATGSGKTTVTSLFLRLYEPEGGGVLVRGRDVREWDRATLRGQFAVVPQDVFLFTGSVFENVAVDAHSSSDAGAAAESALSRRTRAESALRTVGALELLEERGGIDAHVDERGRNFSAGERQLIALARAVYRDASFVVLDEATASVDSETEARLEAAVSGALTGRTSIIVAHRLSTVRRADRILVFHHGRLVESGKHGELVALGGVYAKLVELHFAERHDGSGEGQAEHA